MAGGRLDKLRIDRPGPCGSHVVADRLFEVVLIQLLRWMLDHTEDLGLPAGLLTGLGDDQPGSFTGPRRDRRVETRKCLPSRGNLDLRRFKISNLEGTP